VFPLDQIADVGVSLRRYLKLFRHGIIFKEFQPVWKSHPNVTDRRADGETDDVLWHNRALYVKVHIRASITCLLLYSYVVCEDVDECNIRNFTCCEQLCVNTPGSHRCACRAGFTLADDGCRCRGLPSFSRTLFLTVCGFGICQGMLYMPAVIVPSVLMMINYSRGYSTNVPNCGFSVYAFSLYFAILIIILNCLLFTAGLACCIVAVV